mgnify:CR=1 FL=1
MYVRLFLIITYRSSLVTLPDHLPITIKHSYVQTLYFTVTYYVFTHHLLFIRIQSTWLRRHLLDLMERYALIYVGFSSVLK